MNRIEHERRKFIRNIGSTAFFFGFGAAKLPENYIGLKRGLCESPIPEEDVTWIEIAGQVYGAKPDDTGSLGGGANYSEYFTKGDFEPTNLDELIEALSKAKPGDIVFIPEEQVIDLTTYIYIDQFMLEIPEGVTLAGNRGLEGSKGPF